jgi:taurine dioxygenase
MSERPVVSPLSQACGVLVEGVNAAEPLDRDVQDRLYRLYLEHGLLVLRGQELTPEQHIAFSRIFGQLDPHPSEKVRLAGYPEIYEVSYKSAPAADDGEEIIGRIPWHSDLTYTVRPSRGGLLYAVEVPPEGGETGYLDTIAAYDRLDEATRRRIDDLEVLNSIGQVKQTAVRIDPADAQDKRETLAHASAQGSPPETQPPQFPDVVLPLVVTHPQLGRKALNISPSFTRRILGLPEEEGRELMDRLIAHATCPDFAYIHCWRAGDIVIWDNWRTMHSALGYKAKHRRVMHRTTIRPDFELGRVAEQTLAA